MNPLRNLVLAILAICMAYAVLRYHVLKGVPWSDLPLFVTNKAVSLAAIVLIGLSYCTSRTKLDRSWPCWTGMLGFGLAAVHSFASLALLGQNYYPKFAGPDGYNLIGSLSILFGIISLVCFTCAAATSLPGVRDAIAQPLWKRWQRVGYWGFWLTLAHVIVMGALGWIKPGKWPGGLPPISLLAALVIVSVLVFRLAHRKNPTQH